MDGKMGRKIKKMAPGVGLEPTTLPLTAACSTIELARNKGEPTSISYQMKVQRVKIETESQTAADKID